jgi:hypothetical protein
MPGPQSISFNGAGANKTQANAILVGLGGCSQNGSGSPCTQPGNMMYQPPTTDPYAALQTDPNAIPSAVNGTNCTSATPTSIGTNTYCVGNDPKINNGSTTWPSGTYFFYNTSLTISGTGSFTCSPCTIIFTGPNANKLGLSINGSGTVTMTAPTTSYYADSNYNGVLFYMDFHDVAHSNACGSAPVSIQGSSSVTLNGGMYFPNASVCVTGNAFSSTTSCLSLVAWSIQYTGNATEDLSGCSSTNTKTATVTVVNLVQ